MQPNELEGREIGKRIREQREVEGLSLREVAEKVGVAISTIQRYESGEIRRCKLPVILSIAHALSVSPLWLIGRSEDKEPIPEMGIPYPLEYVVDATVASSNINQEVEAPLLKLSKDASAKYEKLLSLVDTFTDDEWKRLMDYASLLLSARQTETGD